MGVGCTNRTTGLFKDRPGGRAARLFGLAIAGWCAAWTAAGGAGGLSQDSGRSALGQVAVRITLEDGSITPSFVAARANQPVHITVVNAGRRVHNLVIPDFYIFTYNLNPGEQVSVSFTPDKAGAFPFYSDTGGTPEPGMHGTLQVAPAARGARTVPSG